LKRLETKGGRDLLENMRRCVMGSGPGPVEDRSEEVKKLRSKKKINLSDSAQIPRAVMTPAGLSSSRPE